MPWAAIGFDWWNFGIDGVIETVPEGEAVICLVRTMYFYHWPAAAGGGGGGVIEFAASTD